MLGVGTTLLRDSEVQGWQLCGGEGEGPECLSQLCLTLRLSAQLFLTFLSLQRAEISDSMMKGRRERKKWSP
jgi:hypothetical protein